MSVPDRLNKLAGQMKSAAGYGLMHDIVQVQGRFLQEVFDEFKGVARSFDPQGNLRVKSSHHDAWGTEAYLRYVGKHEYWVEIGLSMNGRKPYEIIYKMTANSVEMGGGLLDATDSGAKEIARQLLRISETGFQAHVREIG